MGSSSPLTCGYPFDLSYRMSCTAGLIKLTGQDMETFPSRGWFHALCAYHGSSSHQGYTCSCCRHYGHPGARREAVPFRNVGCRACLSGFK